MRCLIRLAILVIVPVAIALAVIGQVRHHGSNAPNPQTSAVTLYFTCVANADDGYTLAITNANPQTITASQITVAFYDANGAEMGNDYPVFLTVTPDTTYDYHGIYSQTALGGVPYSCKEIQWQQLTGR